MAIIDFINATWHGSCFASRKHASDIGTKPAIYSSFDAKPTLKVSMHFLGTGAGKIRPTYGNQTPF
jgi:hypothetical protein